VGWDIRFPAAAGRFLPATPTTAFFPSLPSQLNLPALSCRAASLRSFGRNRRFALFPVPPAFSHCGRAACTLLSMRTADGLSAIVEFCFWRKCRYSAARQQLQSVIASPGRQSRLSSCPRRCRHGRLTGIVLNAGAGRFTTFRRIALPLVLPGIAAACIFAFLIAMFMAGSTAQTLPVHVWNSVLFQLDPTIAAVSALLVAVSVLALLAASPFPAGRKF